MYCFLPDWYPASSPLAIRLANAAEEDIRRRTKEREEGGTKRVRERGGRGRERERTG